MLNNNFSYTQLSFFVIIQKDSYYVHDDTEPFFLFLFLKDFGICLEPLFIFFFFVGKILITFTCLFSKRFFVFLIYSYFSYISSFLISFIRIFFIRVFFIRFFFVRIFFIRIRRNFYIFNNMFLDFSLTFKYFSLNTSSLSNSFLILTFPKFQCILAIIHRFLLKNIFSFVKVFSICTHFWKKCA